MRPSLSKNGKTAAVVAPQARFRFEMRLVRANQSAVTRPFVATVGFAFVPRREHSLERGWENTLGFVVSAYRVNAENLGGGN